MNKGFSGLEAVEFVQGMNAAREQHAARTKALNSELQARVAALTRTTGQQLRKQEADLNEKLALVQESEARESSEVRARSERRGERIIEAHSSAKRKRAQQIEQREGRRKYLVQKGTLDTEKWRDATLSQIEQEYATLRREIETEKGWVAHEQSQGRKALRGYSMFLGKDAPAGVPGESGNARELLTFAATAREESQKAIKEINMLVLPVVFRIVPWWIWFIVLAGLFFLGSDRIGLSMDPGAFRKWIGIIAGAVVMLLFVGLFLVRGKASRLQSLLHKATALLEQASASAHADYSKGLENTKSTAESKLHSLRQEWDAALGEAGEWRERTDDQLHEQYKDLLARNHESSARRLSLVENKWKAQREEIVREGKAAQARINEQQEKSAREFEEEFRREMIAADQVFRTSMFPLENAAQEAGRWFGTEWRPWDQLVDYSPPEISQLEVGIGKFKSVLPAQTGTESAAELPLVVKFPAGASLFLESSDGGREKAIAVLNNSILRLLASIKPGKVHFTIIDPAALGQSFSGIMHLADYEENIVNRRIWTEPGEIEERLLELNAHMEKVIQMYLRNEFPDIVAYNKAAGRIAEKYHFVVIADFPTNFTEAALRRLLKIANTGARCGVYLLMHWDKSRPLPHGLNLNELTGGMNRVLVTGRKTSLPLTTGGELEVTLENPPGPEAVTKFLKGVGELSRGSSVVQVPFTQVAPPDDKIWSMETTEELRVAIGRSGATKLQYLALGKGTKQHVLIAGKTGSGKSTLLHVMITNLALWYSPDQVQFYLIDFKKGVEFKDYATFNLPHARVIAIESDRQFGLSGLKRVDEELRQRGELFRKHGAQDLAGYKRAVPGQALPRVLLMVDEFQELFVEEDSVSHNAAMLLDRIVRQGRAFGIHVILGSQTLGGAYTLARTTLAQMVIRIALQCSEADAYLIMDESNPAPRLLSRPGEGIYNDSGGTTEANSPFQTVWLPEGERREALKRIANRPTVAREVVVFEGNTLGDVRENIPFRNALEGTLESQALGARIWLGLPNEIKGPTEVVFNTQSGSNLLVVGRSKESMEALLAVGLISLAATERTAEFVVLEGSGPGTDGISLIELAKRLPNVVKTPRATEIGEVINGLAEELSRRENGTTGPRMFLIVENLGAFKALRPEDEFSVSYGENSATPAAQFQKLVSEGAAQGIHLVLTADSFTTTNRFLGRKGLKEFRTRVLFQMSAQDSASLTDDPRANNLGLYRALLYDEQEGRYEVFRPYAPPVQEWIETSMKLIRD